MSLRASAHKNHGMIATGNHSYYKFAAGRTTGVAIRISLRSRVTKLLKRRTDCHTSDIGHWFAMTALP